MKLLVCGKNVFNGEQQQKLRELGFELSFAGSERGPCPDYAYEAEAVVCYVFFNDKDISRFKSLRLIHTTSAGLDHMPLDYISSHGIKLYNASGVYSIPIAEFALGGVLQLYKKAPLFARRQREHVWKQDRGLLELYGKNVCIVGAGSIGTEMARRFSAMGCRVTGLCRRPRPMEYYEQVLGIDRLDSVLPDCDICALSLPLSAETRHLFDASRFDRMKRGAVLVNVARGPVVDTQALEEALSSGRLLGAVLDVCETEPLPQDSPLWDMENLILTPHNSFCGDGNSERMFELIYKDLSEYLRENGGH